MLAKNVYRQPISLSYYSFVRAYKDFQIPAYLSLFLCLHFAVAIWEREMQGELDMVRELDQYIYRSLIWFCIFQNIYHRNVS